ncbi:MAG: UDP-N-acetylmuramate dehydrogenase [Candidatus Omnitrophica bacterium]|nr:UDP-N-acetylmuramate dehydrogenase [Candidatus Omnitrophota bacterium]
MNWFRDLKSKIKTDVLISSYTTFKIGGRAQFFVEPNDIEDLKALLDIAARKKLKIFLLGGGSNILVSDEGVKGIVVRLNSNYFQKIEREDNYLRVAAGVRINRLLNFCLKNRLSGLEFLAGIPAATLGGMVAMNTGTKEGSIGDKIKEVLVMDYNGNMKRLSYSYLKFDYRRSNVDKFIILEALIGLMRKDRREILNRMNYFLNYRKLTQELSLPSAGCIFKNPKGVAAGKLIESSGLKGKSIGGAQISLKHANFIINQGGASAGDVLRLIALIRKKVKQMFNINLELEIKIW